MTMLGNWLSERPPGGLSTAVLLVIAAILHSPVAPAAERQSDILRFIDPLIGTVGPGHVFPGATLPYGMAKAGPDSRSPGNVAGFVFDESPISGFSHLHDSGTGGAPSLGNFPIFVHPSCPDNDYSKCAYSVHSRTAHRVKGSVGATPGYFTMELNNSIRAEMTTTMHTALYRFSFMSGHCELKALYDDETDANPLILLDLIDLSNTQSGGAVKLYPESQRMVGHGLFHPSFGAGNFSAYFCADFTGAKVKDFGTFFGDDAAIGIEELHQGPRSPANPSGSGGGWFRFEKPKHNEIISRVGLSFLSSDQACRNAEQEVPDFDLDRVAEDARDIWRKKLAPIEVDATGMTERMQRTFWSGLYRSFISPQNYTGENPLWNSQEPYFDSFYCIWDAFRAQFPLLTLVDPKALTEMIRTLLDVFRHEGALPDCRMSFCKGYTQGGSNADVVIADAFVKKLRGIDFDMAYYAASFEGRGNRESWRRLGYIAVDDIDQEGVGPHGRTVSRTLEYAYNDFCIATLAYGLGIVNDFERYRYRSFNWRKVWNKGARDIFQDAEGGVHESKFVGFPQPRLANGTFRRQSPRTCSPLESTDKCYLGTKLSTYEGSPWLYSFYVPHDMASLSNLVGGDAALAERLEYFHGSGLADVGNEPAFLTMFQFHYAGRPGRSSWWVHHYITERFKATADGLPGNDDSAMGAFTTMAMMGFFPVAGQDVYLLVAPFFREVRIRSATGTTAMIRKRGSPTGVYIKEATLNGRAYARNWIAHDFFVNGGVLDLEVGDEEGDWGRHHVPPSRSFGPNFSFQT